MSAASGSTSCQVLAPEGILLIFQVATAGDRLAAFLLDVVIVALATAAIGLFALILLISQAGGAQIALAILLVAAFLLRNFYFILSELRWSGTTYGKRKLSLRVIARDGGPLTGDMIVARNLTRDLEIFLPLTVIAVPQSLFTEGAGWGAVVGVLWLLVFAFMPLFGRYRLRCGDLIAGTIVVREPTSALSADVGVVVQRQPIPAASASAAGTAGAPYVFTDRQLDLYGIQELHVLEEILRKLEARQASVELLEQVCERIKKKIGWSRERWSVEPASFLRTFYASQRAHLERKLLFGERKERKSAPGRND